MMNIKNFMKTEGYTKYHLAEISFFDMLQKRNVDKVVISGFGNGTGGRVKIPASLLGDVTNSQLMFVKCNSKGFPSFTEKFVLARARGLAIHNDSYLVAWADKAALPNLKLFPAMCEWSHGIGRSVTLVPIVDKFFEGESFTFANTSYWRVSSASIATAIELLGGKMVGWEERRMVNCSIISPEPISSEVVIDPSWIANMVAVGHRLPSAKWRRECEADEDTFVMGSQVTFASFNSSFITLFQAVCEVPREDDQPQKLQPANLHTPVPVLPAPVALPLVPMAPVPMAPCPAALPGGHLLNILLQVLH
jgi:hypothetical protein